MVLSLITITHANQSKQASKQARNKPTNPNHLSTNKTQLSTNQPIHLIPTRCVGMHLYSQLPALKKQRSADSWGSLSSQPSRVSELQVSEKLCLKAMREKEIKEDIDVLLMSSSGLHRSTYTLRQTHTKCSSLLFISPA